MFTEYSPMKVNNFLVVVFVTILDFRRRSANVSAINDIKYLPRYGRLDRRPF